MTEIFRFRDVEYEMSESEVEELRNKLSEIEPNEFNLRPEVVESKIKGMDIESRPSRNRTEKLRCDV